MNSLQHSPKGFITALYHHTPANAPHTLLVASILGELSIYSLPETHHIFSTNFHLPILAVSSFENTIFILHPHSLSISTDTNYSFSTIDKFSSSSSSTYQCIKINEESNILVLGISDGTIIMYSLPDLSIIDKLFLNEKLQIFDIYSNSNYLIVALANGDNKLFDISSKKFTPLATQQSGFKYPITTDLKFLPSSSSSSSLPHDLIYAQAGIEGKVAVVTTKIESQTDPTVTINTAAKMAPVSNSCITNSNPSGLVVNGDDVERFIFKAHRSNISPTNVLVTPIYSLNICNNYLLTSGYIDANEGVVCLWDVATKRRVKMFKGLPFPVVKTAVVPLGETTLVVCACSDDVYKNMPSSSSSSSSSSPCPSRGASQSSLLLLRL